MTRKEMIAEIARDACCSKRLVRKKLFARYIELKKTHPDILFYKAFMNKDTDWRNWRRREDWRTPNLFEVCFFPSGCVVLFHNVERLYDGEIEHSDCGVRLYSW